MQIVINIDDSTYEAIKNEYCILSPQKGLLKILWDAIKNGIPLPKGHGRLVDEKDLSLMTVHMIDGIFVCDASTIIEADKLCTYEETGCGSCKWQLDCPIEAGQESEEI